MCTGALFLGVLLCWLNAQVLLGSQLTVWFESWLVRCVLKTKIHIGSNIIDHPILLFYYIWYKASLTMYFISKMYQKLLNNTGECLIISSFINAANIGKNFRKMFHNSWGANILSLNSNNEVKLYLIISIEWYKHNRTEKIRTGKNET